VGRQLPVLARALSHRSARWVGLSALVLVSLATTAAAKPKRRDAVAAFDRGVAAYQKNDFTAASVALGKSYELEPDVDTLFAWAQAERKLDHCDKAIELYEKLLANTLPDENRTAVEQKRDECRQVLAAQAPPPVEPAPAPAPAPVMVAPTPPPSSPPPEATHSWYKDPLSLGLVGVGIVGLGVGGGLLASASSLDNQAKKDTKYQAFHDDSQKAKSRGNLGLAIGGAGAVLTIGGVAWIVMHLHRESPPPVTAWLGTSGGGLAYGGAF
jgi:tetratricopeptide (TPR) repeat protein